MDTDRTCSTSECGNTPVFRYTWAGHEEAYCCAGCAERLKQVAGALSYQVQMIPLVKELQGNMNFFLEHFTPLEFKQLIVHQEMLRMEGNTMPSDELVLEFVEKTGATLLRLCSIGAGASPDDKAEEGLSLAMAYIGMSMLLVEQLRSR